MNFKKKLWKEMLEDGMGVEGLSGGIAGAAFGALPGQSIPVTAAQLQQQLMQQYAGPSNVTSMPVPASEPVPDLALISILIQIGPENTKKLLKKLKMDISYIDELHTLVQKVLNGQDDLEDVINECVKEIKL